LPDSKEKAVDGANTTEWGSITCSDIKSYDTSGNETSTPEVVYAFSQVKTNNKAKAKDLTADLTDFKEYISVELVGEIGNNDKYIVVYDEDVADSSDGVVE
jgi:hypothetical protein